MSLELLLCSVSLELLNNYKELAMEEIKSVQTKDDSKETYTVAAFVHMLIGGRIPITRGMRMTAFGEFSNGGIKFSNEDVYDNVTLNEADLSVNARATRYKQSFINTPTEASHKIITELYWIFLIYFMMENYTAPS